MPPTDANKIDEANYTKDIDGRPYYRFSKPGSSYGSDIHVVAINNDGSTATWDIPDGGTRAD